MIIKDKLEFGGEEVNLEYHDCEDFSNLPEFKVEQVYSVCFCGEQLVLGQSNKNKE